MIPQSEDLDPCVIRGAAAVLAAARSLPTEASLAEELAIIEAAQTRGYFPPDDDEAVRLRYRQYLSLRAALLGTLRELMETSGVAEKDWRQRLPAFVTAFAAACILVHATGFLTRLAATHSVLWKKLEEDDLRLGLPRKTFSRLYRESVSPLVLARFQAAAEFYHDQEGPIRALAVHPALAPMVALLKKEQPWIERRRRDAVKRHLEYRWFSFRRRHRSLWRQAMFGLFEAAGCAIADLRQPGVKPPNAPKAITPELRSALLERARPGDVFVTRHDDALSNLFLPGFWPHAALYLGEGRFLESKKDGVRNRPAEETLEVDACVVLRPPLGPAEIATGLARALEHEGKLYDFLFDFRTADRLVCTEVVYRGFHGIGPVNFRLEEVGARLCLPAESLIDQALACGFTVVATCHFAGKPWSADDGTEPVFRASRGRGGIVTSPGLSRIMGRL
jgi:hypothetical protein